MKLRKKQIELSQARTLLVEKRGRAGLPPFAPPSKKMKKKPRYKPPVAGKADTAHAIVRAAISGIPVAGGPLLEFFNLLVAPSLEKRRQKWMEQIAEGLSKLEGASRLTLEDLKDNQSFVTTMMQASQAAIRTHQQEKLRCLRNAVLNSALPNPPNDSLQLMFLSFVDLFTEWHLRILDLFDDPRTWARKHQHQFPTSSTGSLHHILESAFPELKGQRNFYDQIWRDLYYRGLTGIESLQGLMSFDGLMAQRTTELGRTFLSFFTEPVE